MLNTPPDTVRSVLAPPKRKTGEAGEAPVFWIAKLTHFFLGQPLGILKSWGSKATYHYKLLPQLINVHNFT